VSKTIYGVTYQELVDQHKAGGAIDLNQVKRQIQIARYLADMNKYPFIAQGNKTDRQMLTEIGMKEPGGPFLAETRDDELIIRRRDWNKKPYRSYEYGGTDGDLVDYKTDPKDRNRKQNSRNMTFGSWMLRIKDTWKVIAITLMIQLGPGLLSSKNCSITIRSW
jgi:hypothetical protein